MTATSALVRARLETVREGLLEVLGHVEPSLVDWAPAEGMRTIGGQIVEIAGTELQMVDLLKGERFVPDDEVRERIGDVHSLERLQGFLASTRSDTFAFLDGLSEVELQEEVATQAWRIGLPKAPRAEILRSVAQHEEYHVGQLVSYLWARGDDPYKW